jgi:glycosyltransferase involved in cell wall biosynthesis
VQRVIELDISRGLPEIKLDPKYKKYLLLVKWGYSPLGLIHINTARYGRLIEQKTLHSLVFDRLGWEVWTRRVTGTLEHIRNMDSSNLLPISVLVCTRDRPNSLRKCLNSLSNIEYPAYEVVVVDNASQDTSIRKIVESKGFRYVREETPGLNWARNRAYREAKHDIVAYIDDDAIASPGWLHGFAYSFSNPEIMAATGMVLPAELKSSAQISFEIYGGMNKGFVPKTIRQSELDPESLLWASGWGVGANMAFRRELFDHVGGFDPALDVGTATRGGGDIEFFYRTVAAGHSLRYEPAAYIYHVHRRYQAALLRQISDNGHSFPAYLLTVARKHDDQKWRVVSFGVRHWLWNWLLKRGIRAFMQRDHLTRKFVAAELRGIFGAYRDYKLAQRTAMEYEINS